VCVRDCGDFITLIFPLFLGQNKNRKLLFVSEKNSLSDDTKLG